MEQLNEKNLRGEILRDLVDSSIDIDMHTPKIQKDSVVVVMRVEGNYDAGYDLSSFIEKLPFGILDTEVQEVPTPENMYEIYIEFERDDEFPEKLDKMIDTVQTLSTEMEFTGNYYQQDEPLAIDADTTRKFVRLVPEEGLNEFMEMSMSNVIVEGRYITLRSTTYNHEMVFESVKTLSEEEAIKLMQGGWNMLSGLNEAILGREYSAVQVKEGAVLIERDGKHLLFK